MDSKVKELYDDPKTRPVMEKWFPAMLTDPQGKMAMMMKLKQVVSFPLASLNAEQREQLAKELEDAQA
jgi:hypothetical protein